MSPLDLRRKLPGGLTVAEGGSMESLKEMLRQESETRAWFAAKFADRAPNPTSMIEAPTLRENDYDVARVAVGE